MTAALLCEGVSAGYGSSTVVRDVDLTADEGTVVAILGPNGAGKTTLLLALSGLLPRKGGQVAVAGRSVDSGKPVAASRAGLVLVPDNRALFSSLTVAENLKIASGRRGLPPKEMLESFPELESRWNLNAGQLSGGEQQMLAVARALVQRPKVLLVDEMSMGLAPIIVQRLLPIMRRVTIQTGVVLILVEQHVHLALGVSDHALIMAHGSPVLKAPAGELLADMSKVEDAYLGGRD